MQRTPYRFTSKELDEETGLYYFGARYYDPRTSVWQSVDPILGKYLDGQINSGVYRPVTVNLYNYAAWNPVVRVDPDGNADGDIRAWENATRGMSPEQVKAYNEQESQRFVDLAADNAPLVGNLKAATEAYSGKNSITGNQLSKGDRAIAAVGIVLPLVKNIRKIKNPFALGVDEHLDDFAKQHGADTWKQFDDLENWQPQVLDKILDSDQKVLFNLDGVDVWDGVSRAASGRGRATDWELMQIMQNPQAWDTIEFWKGGSAVENPFK